MELSDLGNSAVVRRAIGRGKLQTVQKGCVNSVQPSAGTCTYAHMVSQPLKYVFA